MRLVLVETVVVEDARLDYSHMLECLGMVADDDANAAARVRPDIGGPDYQALNLFGGAGNHVPAYGAHWDLVLVWIRH